MIREPLSLNRAAELDDLFETWRRPGSPGAALAVVQDGQVVYQKGYGMANLEHGIAITPETVFHVASLAKQVTALAVLLLAEQGALSLDDSVHNYLPDLPDFGHRITVRHLLQHTSGLRDQWELLTLAGWRMDDVITQEHILRLVQRQRELNAPPGHAFSYCNTGYTLLAEIVARVTGQPFRQYAADRIFKPLGMERTHFHDDHEEIVPNRADSYTQPPEAHGFRKSVLNYANVGATSLLTTAADVAKWLANFQQPEVGSANLLRQMLEPARLNDGQTVAYGYGLGLGVHRGFRVAQHIGIDAGYRSFLCWFPDLQVGMAILANLATIDVHSLAKQVADRYLEGRVEWQGPPPVQGVTASPGPQPEALVLTDHQLQPYAGSYYSEELDTTYRIDVDQGDLIVRHLKRPDLRCSPVAPDTFVAGPLTLRFVAGGSGVMGVRLDGVRVRNLWFAKLG